MANAITSHNANIEKLHINVGSTYANYKKKLAGKKDLGTEIKDHFDKNGKYKGTFYTPIYK